MRARRTAERPQRGLQALGQPHIALATQNDVRAFEAGEHQP